MKRDRLDDALKHKLHDASAPMVPPAWETFQQRRVAAQGEAVETLKGETKSLLPEATLRRFGSGWMRYAAAVLIVVVVGLGVLRMQDTADQVAQQTSTDMPFDLPGIDRAVPISSITPVSAERNPVLDKLFKSARRVTSLTAKQTDPLLHTNASQPFMDLSVSESESPMTQLNAGPQAFTQTPEKQGETSRRQWSAQAPMNGNSASGYDWDKYKPKVRKSWMASAYSSTFASSQEASGGSLKTPSALTAALVEANFAQNAVDFTGRNLQHHFPISVGVTVKRNLTSRWGVETGLVYTYLESSGSMSGEFSYKHKQQLHYLGIPINFSYSFLQNKNWDLYATGGVMGEIALSTTAQTRIFARNEYASTVDTDLGAKGLLWSAGLGAGVSYDFVRNFGIYAEPGINYYFSNDNHPVSYRTENPWSFNVRVGVRVKF